MPFVADLRVTMGGAPLGVSQPSSCQAAGLGSTIGSMSSRTTSDSRAQPPKNLTLHVGVPITYVVFAAPLCNKCEVHEKPSGGCIVMRKVLAKAKLRGFPLNIEWWVLDD
jgi:hypothetical protein